MRLSRKISIFSGAGLLLILILLGSISFFVPGDHDPEDPVVAGKYRLTSVQDGKPTNFEGSVYFEFARQQSGLRQTPVFKLHFINPETDKGCGFGFLIPLRPDHSEIGLERYRVQAKESNTINEFETVFGYADMDGQDPALYFTESGDISISSSSTREVAGNMNMLLKDPSGRTMHIQGQFNARPLNAQRIN